ncbi:MULTISPECIES: response regulator [Desertifilum]|uniref:histidine kinase n=1 Tax=Desertifilum tharense IPPAS B-1220 TaxID=1781255 RepID=A0A1E5QJ29_9CYAN|nr:MULTISPECIES: response regulator [Desertifilum]MBD2320415.1 response regulator [Desertifilum sp. FACHB-866]MBD2330543.1 response regulator [Desertifilum sp. FACHB-868]OEJ74353.1 hypothetical protein BH720_14065 [Desertifilum tharense IPPAS B-1220]
MVKILVIEDNSDLREEMLLFLEEKQIQAIGAEDGVVGFELAQEFQPDLILCDLMMPKRDGYETLRALRNHSSTVHIPVVFLTALSERANMRKAMENGADDYLTKPFTPDELLNTIAACLNKENHYQSLAKIERERADALEQEIQLLKEINSAKENLLNKLIQEMSDPLTTINLALEMVDEASTEARRRLYLKTLKKEFSHQVQLINQATDIRKLLTPENIHLLRYFNISGESNPANETKL